MIVIGVDVHKHSLTAVAVDELGRTLAEYAGLVDEQVLVWARSLESWRELPFIKCRSQHREEVQGPLRHQCRRVCVVAGKRGVDEEVLVAGVDEQFGPVRPDQGNQFAGSVDVALVGEELVVRLAVDLNGQIVGPRAEGVFAGDREASFIEQRPTGTATRLGEPLCGANTPRNAGVHQSFRQRLCGTVRLRVE
jgi:hypothetical protein